MQIEVFTACNKVQVCNMPIFKRTVYAKIMLFISALEIVFLRCFDQLSPYKKEDMVFGLLPATIELAGKSSYRLLIIVIWDNDSILLNLKSTK